MSKNSRIFANNPTAMKTFFTILITVTMALFSASVFSQNAEVLQIVSESDTTENIQEACIFQNVFRISETPPRFPGTEAERMRFNRNLRYPEACRDSNIQGTVLVSFIVETDGSLTNIVIASSPCPNGCFDKEAIRFIESMPKWIPGRNRGQIVRTRFMYPLKFTLSE